MAIEGLISAEVSSAPSVEVNMRDRAALAMEALRLLGRLGDDHEATRENIRNDFNKLGRSVGETYIQLPFGSGFTLLSMLHAIDGVRYPDIQIFPDQRTYPVTYPLEENDKPFAKRLWLPQDPRREGYSIAEINRLDVIAPGDAEPAVRPAHARIALWGGSSSEEPLLHLLDMPYDKMHATLRQRTQLDQLAVKKAEFVHAGLELSPINLAGFAMLALQRRIEGSAMPASWGRMVVPQLGRKTIGSMSVIGRVYTYGNQITLDYSKGDARPGNGVGLSVGRKSA